MKYKLILDSDLVEQNMSVVSKIFSDIDISDYDRYIIGKNLDLDINTIEEGSFSNMPGIFELRNELTYDKRTDTLSHNYYLTKIPGDKVRLLYVTNNKERQENAKSYIFWSVLLLDMTDLDNVLKMHKSVIFNIDQLTVLPKNRLLTINEYRGLLKTFRSMKICEKGGLIIFTLEYINSVHNVRIPTNIVLRRDNLILTDLYFDYMRCSKCKLYSLGDSLDKYNFIYNVFEHRPIINIPFSGSMYEDVRFDDGTEEIFLLEGKRDDMIKSLPVLIRNNPGFKSLIEDIKSGEKVIISDYGHTGKAYITIVNLINMLGDIDWTNVTYLQITPNIDQIVHNVKVILNDAPRPEISFIEEMPDQYFTNSDRPDSGFNSRCVPRYEVSKWNNPPEKVWFGDDTGNYYLCNLHRLLIMMQMCFYIKK